MAELIDDACDTSTLHADAGSDRVDAVVIRLNGHLGALARNPDHLLDGDKTVGNLRNLLLEEPLKEERRSSGECYDWVVVSQLYICYNALYRVALAEEI